MSAVGGEFLAVGFEEPDEAAGLDGTNARCTN